jgi:hypothetical protein
VTVSKGNLVLSNSICSNLFELSPREPPWRSHHPRLEYPSTLAPSALLSRLSISSQRPGHWASDGLATQISHQDVRNRGCLAMSLAPSSHGPDSTRQACPSKIFSIRRAGGARGSEAGRISSPAHEFPLPSPQTDDRRWCGGLLASGARGPPPLQPCPCALILHGFGNDDGGEKRFYLLVFKRDRL